MRLHLRLLCLRFHGYCWSQNLAWLIRGFVLVSPYHPLGFAPCSRAMRIIALGLSYNTELFYIPYIHAMMLVSPWIWKSVSATKWQIHPFIFKGTIYDADHPVSTKQGIYLVYCRADVGLTVYIRHTCVVQPYEISAEPNASGDSNWKKF